MAFLHSCIYLATIGILSFILGRILPKRFFTCRRFPYKSLAFEQNGKLYLRFGIQRWQAILPDMSRILPQFLPRKRIERRPSDAQLTAMIRETCVAEFIHWVLCFAGAYVLHLQPGVWGWIVYGVYVLLGNLPFIVIQRFNRPRLIALRDAQRRSLAVKRGKRIREEKKILVLSCNTGEGHNSCAKALREAFDEQRISCTIDDALRFVSPGFSSFMAKGHVFVYRHLPRLFRFGYRFSEKHPKLFHESSLLYWAFALGSDALASHIVDEGYDAVISVHVFASLILTEMQKRHGLKLRTAFAATDYTSSPSMQNSDLDYYFIPDPSLMRDFAVGPITRERIICSGIPVRQNMYAGMDRAQARRALGIPQNARHLLVMCGSMGCGPLKWLLALIKLELRENQYITVLCGTNEKLLRTLTRRYGKHPQMQICGYRSDISTLMDSADLYLTKPGGLSVTEAAVKNLPMVMINAVAGCEEYNKNFFVKCGLGVSADSIFSLSRLCMDILSDDASLQRLRDAGGNRQWPNAPRLIRDHMLREI